MQAAELQHYQNVLDQLVAELRKTLEQLDTTPVSPDNAIGRLTRMEAMQSQQLAQEMARRERARLRELEDALKRIARGEYGICTRCEEEISPARLRVRPEARLCLACASK